MEELYLTLSKLLNFVIEFWPVLLLVLVSFRWKSYLLSSAAISILLSLIILGRISTVFVFIFWILIWILMWYEGDDTKEGK